MLPVTFTALSLLAITNQSRDIKAYEEEWFYRLVDRIDLFDHSFRLWFVLTTDHYTKKRWHNSSPWRWNRQLPLHLQSTRNTLQWAMLALRARQTNSA